MSANTSPADVPGLLFAWSQGDRAALDRLVPPFVTREWPRAKAFLLREPEADGGGRCARR